MSEVWTLKNQPSYIFNKENPKNWEPQNGPVRGLDFIALPTTDVRTTNAKQNVTFVSGSCVKSKSKSKVNYE